MPNRTSLIYSDNPGTLPAAYTLPPSLELVLQSVVARFDGSAAAGAFYPCLAVYSQDGRLMGRFRPDATMAVGDTGVVTFAPFLKATAAAVTSTGGQPMVVAAVDGVTITQGTTSNVYPFASLVATDSTYFALDGTIGTINVLKAGLYYVSARIHMFNNTIAAGVVTSIDLTNPAGANNSALQERFGQFGFVTGVPAGPGNLWRLYYWTYLSLVDTFPQKIGFRVTAGAAAANWTNTAARMAIHRVGDATSTSIDI